MDGSDCDEGNDNNINKVDNALTTDINQRQHAETTSEEKKDQRGKLVWIKQGETDAEVLQFWG